MNEWIIVFLAVIAGLLIYISVSFGFILDRLSKIAKFFSEINVTDFEKDIPERKEKRRKRDIVENSKSPFKSKEIAR